MWQALLGSLLSKVSNKPNTSGIQDIDLIDGVKENQYKVNQNKSSGVLGGLASQWMNRGTGGTALKGQDWSSSADDYWKNNRF